MSKLDVSESDFLRADDEGRRKILGRLLDQDDPISLSVFEALEGSVAYSDFASGGSTLSEVLTALKRILKPFADGTYLDMRNPDSARLTREPRIQGRAGVGRFPMGLQLFEETLRLVVAQDIVRETCPFADRLRSHPAMSSLLKMGQAEVFDAMSCLEEPGEFADLARARWPMSWSRSYVTRPSEPQLEQLDLMRQIRRWADVASLTGPYPPETLVGYLLGLQTPAIQALSMKWDPNPRLPLGAATIKVEVSPFISEPEFYREFKRFRRTIVKEATRMPSGPLLNAASIHAWEPGLKTSLIIARIEKRYGRRLQAAKEASYFTRPKGLRNRLKQLVQRLISPPWHGPATLDSRGMSEPIKVTYDANGRPVRKSRRMPVTPGTSKHLGSLQGNVPRGRRPG